MLCSAGMLPKQEIERAQIERRHDDESERAEKATQCGWCNTKFMTQNAPDENEKENIRKLLKQMHNSENHGHFMIFPASTPHST